MARPQQDRAFQFSDGVAGDRGIAPLPGWRALLALDRDRERVRAQRARQDEDCDPHALVWFSRRRIPIRLQDTGHRVFRRYLDEIERVMCRFPNNGAHLVAGLRTDGTLRRALGYAEHGPDRALRIDVLGLSARRLRGEGRGGGWRWRSRRCRAAARVQ